MGSFIRSIVVSASAGRGIGRHACTATKSLCRAEFTGAHLLSVAVAGCVLNDVYREACSLGIHIECVRVTASGDFDRATWESTGIDYAVDIDSPADEAEISRLLSFVDDVAEIPKALRAGGPVARS